MAHIGYPKESVRNNGEGAIPLGEVDRFSAKLVEDHPTPGETDISNGTRDRALLTARLTHPLRRHQYQSHAGESREMACIELPQYPVIFGRWHQSLVVDGAAVPVALFEDGLDREVPIVSRDLLDRTSANHA